MGRYVKIKTLVLSLLILSCILNSQAAEHREYILSNLSSLLHSYSSVDFTRDSEEAIDQTKYNCAIKMNEFNREQLSVLSDLFSKFKSHEISEDALLRKVLDIRFRNINFFQRHQGFKLHRKNDPLRNMLQGGGTITAGSIHIENKMDLVGDYVKFITTSQGGSHNIRFISKKEEEIYKLFGEWIPEYESSKQIEVRESFTSLVNDNMYVLNQIILGIYSLRSPSYFSDDTYDFIKASQSLWPSLEQVAKGADPFLLDDETNVFENRGLLKEYEYYAICLLNISGKNKPIKGLGCTGMDFVKVYGPLKDSGIIEGDWSLPALPKQLEEFSKPKVGNWSLPVLPSQSEELSKPKIGANEKMKKRKKKKKASHQETRSENESQAQSLPTASSQVLLNDDLLKKDLELLVNKPESLQVDETIDEDMLNEILPSAAEAAASTAGIGAVSSPHQHIYASWNRKLHYQRTLQAIPIRTEPIPNTHLKVLQTIFEDTSKVSYRNFESLWLHLNGENSIKSSKKGTSHRRLLNSDGKVVGGTFALNGGKRQYSSHHLKELRDALTLIGYGTNYLSSY